MKSMQNRERAQRALKELKEAILAEIESSDRGLRNADLVKSLGLESEYEGRNRNYLSWPVLGILLAERKIRYRGAGQQKRYISRETPG